MKLTDEQIEDLRYSVLDDSVKIIDYLDKKFDEQEKRNRSNTIFYNHQYCTCFNCCNCSRYQCYPFILITTFITVKIIVIMVIITFIAINSICVLLVKNRIIFL